jgi:hypothetical protein
MQKEIKKMKPRRAGDEESSNSVKIAWIVGAVGLCIMLVAGIAIASGDNKKKAPSIVAQENTESAPAAVQTSAPATPTLKIEQVEVPPLSIYRRRNPFTPLVNMQAVTSGAVAPTSVPGAGGAVSVVTVPPDLRTGPNAPPETLSSAITLDGVYKQGDKSFARIRVGDQLYDGIASGQTFANNYKLLALGGDSSATILFGDERFTIFTGQSIYL